MVSVSLCEFVRSGQFGPFMLGMARYEVQKLIGNPEDWGTESHCESATIWRYADIEFYFTDDKLRMIFTDHDDLTDGGSTISIDPWVVRRGLRLVEFESALRFEDIPFTVTRPTFDPCQRLLTTQTGVQFAFIEERDADFDDHELGLFSWNLTFAISRLA